MSTPFLGGEHSGYLDQHHQRQTVSPRDTNIQGSTSYPGYQQLLSLQGYGPAGMSASRSPTPAQGVSSAQYQTTGEAEDKPVRRGRGTTGMPRGRPPGAKNKPKTLDHGLPKVPKKKGRPLGAKNKYPRGAHNAYKYTPDSDSSPIERGSPPTPSPTVEPTFRVMTPSTPTEAQTTNPIPDGYAQRTGFSGSVDPNDRGYDFGTRASGGYGWSGNNSGFEYPSPHESSPIFGNSHYTYGSTSTNSGYGSYNYSSSSSGAFASSSSYVGGISGNWDQPPPPGGMTGYGYHDPPAPTIPQAYDASSSATGAENGPPNLGPSSSMAPNPGTEAQDKSPAPATPGPDDNTSANLVPEPAPDPVEMFGEDSSLENFDTAGLERELSQWFAEH